MTDVYIQSEASKRTKSEMEICSKDSKDSACCRGPPDTDLDFSGIFRVGSRSP